MKLIFSDIALKEFADLEQELRSQFIRHLEKIQEAPPRKHLKHCIPCHVEKVTKQARIVYNIERTQIYILHFFSSHKEYERWYKSYK
ncbi:hypothetical protein [Methanothrix sp.]|jgi:phage-related protein|uniref:hypothetical protein n=1 Tax=Methanothrix sp. TaxID=90426 RepID=UPI0032AF8860